ncbi:uncharacterized protein CTRU02_210753 [Colletotrichum truncatum]|uniref:Uncharacterized protein n=1 Tax=Colletotrichum truncatum TaxID=5467 RepID=A0ACC3YPW2_COLTU
MSVVDEAVLQNFQDIAKLQTPIDAAQDSLNSLISSKRSLTMTKTELKNLRVGTDALDSELEKLNPAADNAAADYTIAKMAAEPQTIPVDYLRSETKTIPFANDSMSVDLQYFSSEPNSQNPSAHSAQITSGSSMMEYAMNESQKDKGKFSIISGATFGSSFVGMVHVLNSTNNSASKSMEAAAASIQRTMDAGA